MTYDVKNLGCERPDDLCHGVLRFPEAGHAWQSAHFDLFIVHFMIQNMVVNRVNLHDAKTNLSRYLAELRPGEPPVLCNRNQPVAEPGCRRSIRIRSIE